MSFLSIQLFSDTLGGMSKQTSKEAKILSGLPVRDEIARRLRLFISRRRACNQSIPCLAIIQVGDLPESAAYIHHKKLFAEKIGAIVRHIQFDATITEKEIVNKIKKLNKNKKVHGIIVQLPLPQHISSLNVIEAIDSKKDVDGLTSVNVKYLQLGNKTGIIPATARGVLSLIKAYNISVEGKRVVVVGRSVLVGAPIAQCLLRAGATVTICHKLTQPLHKFTSQADVLIVAAGSPKLISKKFVNKKQIIVDVGITAIEHEGKRYLIGDVDSKKIKSIVSAYSPVPGGVGPLTVASLFENLCEVVE